MIVLELDDVLAIACEVLQLEADDIPRVTDLGLADSALARPQAGFGDEEFYPTIEAKVPGRHDTAATGRCGGCPPT